MTDGAWNRSIRLRSVLDHDDGETPVGEELVSSQNPGPLEAGGDELLPYQQAQPRRVTTPLWSSTQDDPVEAALPNTANGPQILFEEQKCGPFAIWP